MDRLTKAQRSYCMSRIGASNTGPELNLRKALWQHGVRYRLKSRLPGHPDIVIPRFRIAVFVDGCFWHGCPIHGIRPKTNKRFWSKKLSRNAVRDREVTKAIRKNGWSVIRFWEHDVESKVDKCAKRVLKAVETERSAALTGVQAWNGTASNS